MRPRNLAAAYNSEEMRLILYAAERSVRPRNLAAAYNSEGAQYFYTPLVDLSGRDLTAAYKISNK